MIKATYGVLARVFAIVLIVVGAAAIFGGTYAHGFVTEQLKQERITMPTQEGIDKLEDQASKKFCSSGSAKISLLDHKLKHLLTITSGST